MGAEIDDGLGRYWPEELMSMIAKRSESAHRAELDFLESTGVLPENTGSFPENTDHFPKNAGSRCCCTTMHLLFWVASKTRSEIGEALRRQSESLGKI